jgi:phage shock protein C
MMCSHCQRDISDSSNFCSYCGARQRPTGVSRRLMRSAVDSKLGGVCGGIGEYFDVDPTMVRLLWAVLSVVPGAFVGGVLAYILAWAIVPKAPLPFAAPGAAALEHAAK